MVETFETNINMLAKSLKDSENEKKFLAEELNKRKGDTFRNSRELANLKVELEKMQKLYAKVPEPIRMEIEARKKKRSREMER